MPDRGSAVPALAFVYQRAESARRVRDVIAATGTAIVYESALAQFDPGTLDGSGARVVVVNLDADAPDSVDDVLAALESGRYTVVLNDAEASAGLDGWDEARWARHLAAKITGGAYIDPPRPPGAEPIPVPEPPAAGEPSAGAPHAAAAEAPVPQEVKTVAAPVAGGHDVATEASDAPLAVAADASATGTADTVDAPGDLDFDFESPVAMGDLDAVSTEGLADAQRVPESVTGASEAPDEIPVPIEWTLDIESEAGSESAEDLAGAATKPPETEAGGDGVLPSVPEWSLALDGDDAGLAEAETGDEGQPEPAVRADFDPQVPDWDLVSIALPDDQQPAVVPAAAKAATSRAPAVSAGIPPAYGEADNWTLEELLDAVDAGVAGEGDGAAAFGIETVSAAEFLAPDAPAEDSVANAAPVPLERIPLEEAVAPQPFDVAPGPAPALGLESAAVIERVWVLAASIGGPEAVREFLAAIPAGYPALFLLAQHMGAEFADVLARQLARATPLTVRTPQHGDRVGHGEVVVVPAARKLSVGKDGIVTLEDNETQAEYLPSIDQVLYEVADRFGASAGAIVFSGMTNDAVEGCSYLALKGGKVYAQDPATCVVSSMVDGVREAGLASMTAAPRALAESLLAGAR